MVERFPAPALRRSSSRVQRGQGLAEYVIALVGLAVVSIAIIVSYGGRLQGLFGVADEEVGALASGEYSGGTAGTDSGGTGPESDSSGGAGDDWGRGDDGFGRGSSGSMGSPSSNAAASSAGRTTRVDRRGDGIVRPSRERRRGQYTIGEGSDSMTVVTPSRGRAESGSVDRRRATGSSRQAEEARWDRKRREALDEPANDEGLGRGKRVISFLGIVMVGLLGLGGAVIVRFGLAALGDRDS